MTCPTCMGCGRVPTEDDEYHGDWDGFDSLPPQFRASRSVGPGDRSCLPRLRGHRRGRGHQARPPRAPLGGSRHWDEQLMAERCAECDGTGEVLVDSMSAVGVPGGWVPDWCPSCQGERLPADPTVTTGPTPEEWAALGATS